MIPLLQAIAIALCAPLLHGAMKTLRARLQGKPGPPLLQPYLELRKLMHKASMLPDGVSPIVAAAPGIALGAALTFAAVVPLRRAPGGIVDVVALAFLLGGARFALALAAIDSRSAFAGMAASRDIAFGALVEPALLVALLLGAASGQGTSFSALAGVPFGPSSVLAFAALFCITLAETARVPIDNQETHYELTMIHEGLSLEYGGPQLALLKLSAYVKETAFFILAAALLPGPSWIAHLGWVAAIALTITLVETALAKLRLFEVPQVLLTAFLLASTSIGLQLAGGLP
jgi:formate hydrogenlyase subunit 4